jgi:tRNA threonylcarbamoyladenosine biosynthesis protein TsaE
LRLWSVDTSSPEETRRLGTTLGSILEKPTVLLLTGDLGAGKTCLVQGIAQGLGVPAEEAVTSPSYTLMNPYRGRLDLYHFDLYRLQGADDLIDLDFEEYAGGQGVTVVEWADRALDMEREGLVIHLCPRGSSRRRIDFQGRGLDGEALLENLERAWRDKERETP